MWWYAVRLKCTPFWGNFFVALFCAGVAGILLFAERSPYQTFSIEAPGPAKETTWIFIAYLGFAFLSTLFREIIKDIEDKEGDQKAGCRTLPIVLGTGPAKGVASFSGGITSNRASSLFFSILGHCSVNGVDLYCG